MSLQVDPSALQGYSALLARAADDARECRSYFGRHVPEIPPVTGGIINPFTYDHLSVRRQLTSMLDQLVTLMDAAHTELRAAASRYQRTDESSAADLDASFAPVVRPAPRRD